MEELSHTLSWGHRSLLTLSLICLSQETQSAHTQYSAWVADGGPCRVPGRPLSSLPPPCRPPAWQVVGSPWRPLPQPPGLSAFIPQTSGLGKSRAWSSPRRRAGLDRKLMPAGQSRAGFIISQLTCVHPAPTSVVTRCHHCTLVFPRDASKGPSTTKSFVSTVTQTLILLRSRGPRDARAGIIFNPFLLSPEKSPPL